MWRGKGVSVSSAYVIIICILSSASFAQHPELGSAPVVFQLIGVNMGRKYILNDCKWDSFCGMEGVVQFSSWYSCCHSCSLYAVVREVCILSSSLQLIVAPKTIEQIYKLVRLGCYNPNDFFQVASGRSAPMNEEQREEAFKTVVGKFSDVKHVRGILSMGRHSDPNSGGSLFSILLRDAPHLDGQALS